MDKLPFNADSVVATLASLFHHQQKKTMVKILKTAKATIEDAEYDNWDGGTYYYTLCLDIAIELFALIESSLSKYEKEIESKLHVVLRGTGNHILNKVIIRPIPVDEPMLMTSSLIADESLQRIWGDNQLRLFICHRHTDKISAVYLKNQLAKFNVSAFVAHEDIEPTLVWQREIRFALTSMNVFVALLTPDFRDSKWTDQEIGFAVAKKVLIIHVRDGLDPYGFIGETQSLSTSIDSPEELSWGIIKILLKDISTQDKMREALFVALEGSNSHTLACEIMRRIKSLEGGVTQDEIQRIKKAASDNTWVKDAYTVKDFLGRIKETALADEAPF